MSYARLVVGNKSGTILDEIESDIAFVNWRLNKVGKCEFTVPANYAKSTAENFKYGNRVLIEFENGLPNWGGVIDPPRTWDGELLKITAYSGEHLFLDRTTDKGRYFTNEPVGAIFEALINDANGVEATGVDLGSIYKGGSSHSPDYHFKSLLLIFQNSLTGRLSTYDFDVTASLVGGKITFAANLYEVKGASKPAVALIQDKNIARFVLKEQGPIINSQDAAGEGTGWGDERLTANAQDLDSINEFGLRQGAKIYGDVKEQTTLDSHVATSLAKTKNPYNIFTLDVLDLEPGLFASYGVGDSIGLQAHGYGFEGVDTTIRILSREYSPADGVCSLVVEEVF